MKKTYLKSFCARFLTLLILALLSTNLAWGEVKTATFTMKNSGQSSPVIINGVTFTWSSSNIVVGTNNGSGFKSGSNMTVTIPTGKKLTGIEKGNGNTWGGGAQIDVYAGSSSSGTKIATIVSGTNTYSITSNNTGTTYYLANSTTKNAWINTLIIKYDDADTPTRTLNSIYISGTATKLEYFAGESFDFTGLKVMGKYDTGDDTEITSGITWSFNPEVFAIGDETVSVTAKVGDFTSNPLTVNVTVNEKPAAKYVPVAWKEIEDGGKYFITADNEGEYYFAAKVFAAGNATAIAFDAALAPEADMWTFTKNGDTWKISTADGAGLYMTNNNNGLVCAANKGAEFTIAQGSSAEFTDLTASDGTNKRYVALYDKQDFRCYKTSGTSGIRDLKLYCKGATVTITAAKYATLGLPYAVKIPTGVSAYTATVKDTKVTMTKIQTGKIPANCGVILYADVDKATTYTFYGTTTEESYPDNNLVAVTNEGGKDINGTGEGIYFLSTNTNGVVFKLANSGNIPQYKAYLQSAGSKAKLDVVFGEPTGITSYENDNDNENFKSMTVYNLNGMKVNNNYKGIVIMNGKKYINK